MREFNTSGLRVFSEEEMQFLDEMADLYESPPRDEDGSDPRVAVGAFQQEAILDEIMRQRDHYYFRFARGLAKNSKPVDQREVDYKRGVWWGAFWATVMLPRQAIQAMERDKALEDLPDEEESGTT